MPKSRLTRFSTCLVTLFSLTCCTSAESPPQTCSADDPSCAAAGGTNGAGGSSQGTAKSDSTSKGGATSAGGSSAKGSSTSKGGTSSKSGSTADEGGTSSADSTTSKGGSASEGGSSAKGSATSAGGTSTKGGSTSAGGSSAKGGSTSAGGTSSKGGSTSAGGTSSAGGSTAAGGTSATTTSGPKVDAKGVPLAKAGDQKSGSSEFLNLGDMRLINNKWGSDALNCNTAMKVYVNSDKTLGWEFNRGACLDKAEKPDYPEIEFGIHPFGIGSSLETSPPYSSTTLLPLQIKDIKSASVTVDNANITITNAGVWNLNFEMWFSQRHPVTDPNPGVYAEVMVFWGWKYSELWKCDASGNVTSSGKAYNLCHQSDSWGQDPKWRYFHFNNANGSSNSFSGKIDAKVFLDLLVNTYKFSTDLWVTRLEVGSEVGDNTAGKVAISNISFEVNGTTKSVELAQ